MSFNHQFVKPPSSIVKTGDIIVFHGHGIFSRLIQFYTNSYWNHIALVTRIFPGGKIGIIESSGHGVRPNTLDEKNRQDIRILRIKKVTKKQKDMALETAYSFGPNTYDWLQIIRFVTRRIIRRKYTPDDKFICSELVAEAWKKAGIDLFNGAPTPASIASNLQLRHIWGPNVN